MVTNNGPKIREFENKLSDYLGLEEIILMSSGYDALFAAFKALEIGKGKVILPSYTYIASINAVINNNLEPLFCDIEADSFVMDLKALEELLEKNKNVSAIMIVNVFGVAPQLTQIRELADKYSVPVLYDNCHGLGTEDKRFNPYEICDLVTHSLHATKTLPAIEGGFAYSRDEKIRTKLKSLRNHGLVPDVVMSTAGVNAKMDEIRALVGLNSLKHFDEALKNRRSYANQFRQAFSEHPDIYQNQVLPGELNSNFQNIGTLIKKTDTETGIALFEKYSVSTRKYFHPPLHHIKAFSGFGNSGLTNTEEVWSKLLSFPIYSLMTKEELDTIINAIHKVAEELGG